MSLGPQPTPAAHPAVERITDHVMAGRVVDCYAVVDDLLLSGWNSERIVTDVLAVFQQEVGLRWQSGAWTVAQEHAASAVVDDLLGALGRHVPTSVSHGTVALVCAEGEWHVTPARMAALLLRLHGWHTSFLGGSTPPEQLARTLEDSRPTYLAVSCTRVLSLLGAARIAAVARKGGIPTLAGGPAFGTDPRRAERLGFDGWAPDIAAASAILTRWLDEPPPPAPGPPTEDLDDRAGAFVQVSIVEQTIQRLADLVPSVLHHGERPLALVRQDLSEILQAAHLAALTEDPRVFTDHLRWLAELQPARGLPHAAIRPSVAVLRDLSAPLGERTQAILAQG